IDDIVITHTRPGTNVNGPAMRESTAIRATLPSAYSTIVANDRCGRRAVCHANMAITIETANTASTTSQRRTPFHAATGKNAAIARYAPIAVLEWRRTPAASEERS